MHVIYSLISIVTCKNLMYWLYSFCIENIYIDYIKDNHFGLQRLYILMKKINMPEGIMKGNMWILGLLNILPWRLGATARKMIV